MLIGIEGINGTGKTTVGKKLVEYLSESGHNTKFIRLPQVGKFREALLIPGLSPQAKFHLYLADMANFYSNIESDTIYIVDRSYISTIVYQTYEGVSLNLIEHCLRCAKVYLDYCLLLTCDPKIAKERRENYLLKDGGNPGGFANRSIKYYKDIEKNYKIVVDSRFTKENHRVIDNTNLTIDETFTLAKEFVSNIFASI